MKTIFSDDIIEVIDQEKDFDFIATIINKTDETIMIDFYDLEESIKIEPSEWIGLLADDEGYMMLEQFRYFNFIVNIGEE